MKRDRSSQEEAARDSRISVKEVDKVRVQTALFSVQFSSVQFSLSLR